MTETPGQNPDPNQPGPYGQPGAYGQPPPYGQPPSYAQPPHYAQPSPYGPGYGQPPGYPPQYGYPGAAYGYPPGGIPWSDKSKVTAGLLGIFLGIFGVGRFYTGHVGMGIGQLVVSVLTCGIGGLWGAIDGILILANGGTDAQGRPLHP